MSQQKLLGLANKLENADCNETVLNILDFCSPLTQAEIVALLRNTPPPTLQDLGISSAKCDSGVRVLLNKKVRIPRGLSPLPPGSVSPADKVASLLTDNCGV